MRVIASVQSKRGSSRGLVHYIAHSKIDTEREPEKGREMFNAFADELSVKSANNSIKSNVGRKRPANDDLHHLVLSFRPDDYRALGRTEKQKRVALKKTTRAAMERLESFLNADRICWAAAVHLNTENPHVHIAIQKEFLNRKLELLFMTKIPREVLPHFELRDGEKILTPGVLIEASTERLEQLVAGEIERTSAREAVRTRNEFGPLSRGKTDGETDSGTGQEPKEERDILRRGILAEHELQRIESQLEILTDHGDRMKFLVSDAASGQKRRLSLHDLKERGVSSDLELNTSTERQIRAILLKMFAREEASKYRIQKTAASTIRAASEIKKIYKKNGWKLPTPSLTKDELDKLQEHCLGHSDIRGLTYLESIRTELERGREIEPRTEEDFGRLAADKTISEMRKRLFEKNYADLNDRQYIRIVDVGERKVSLAQLDREEAASTNSVFDFAKKIKDEAFRLAGKRNGLPTATENDRLRHDIVCRLGAQLSGIRRDQRSEEKKVRVIAKILTTDDQRTAPQPVYSTDQLAELDTLSLRLKMKEHYERSWNEQKILIESAGSDSRAYRKLVKATPAADFASHKSTMIAGRAIAREIVARVELDKAKGERKAFTKSKRFERFAIADKSTGEVAFLSLNDVDPLRRKSVLDQAIDAVFESREHRAVRKALTSLVKGREQRLKDEVSAAKTIADSSARDAAEFKQSSFFGLINEPVCEPRFTSSEIIAIEKRASATRDSSEAARLQKILESAANQPAVSLGEMLGDFQTPRISSTQEKGHDPDLQKTIDRTPAVVSEDPTKVPIEAGRIKEPKAYGHHR